jgi:hypothetical protein
LIGLLGLVIDFAGALAGVTSCGVESPWWPLLVLERALRFCIGVMQKDWITKDNAAKF